MLDPGRCRDPRRAGPDPAGTRSAAHAREATCSPPVDRSVLKRSPRRPVPRYARCTSALAWTAAGVPDISTRPRCRTVTSVASPKTRSRSCSTKISVMSAGSPRRRSSSCAGLGGERDGNLELATLGIGQRFDRVVGTVLDADDREHVVDPRRPGRPARYRQPRPPMPALDGQRHVVRGGQGPEKAGVLERLADARLRPACLRRVRDVPPVEPDMATGDAHSSGDQPEQRTLAGAVGPDECMPGPLRHGQVDAVHRMQRAERTAYAHTSQHVIHPASLAFDRGCCPRRDRRSPAIPRGSAYTTTMKTRPSTSGPRPPRLGASESRTRITRAAPRQGPQIVPLPPMTTASSASADVVKPRSAGVTSRCWAASSPPASPATAPAATNAASLYRNGWKPIARIRDSLSRMPRSVAPKGDAESDHRTSSPTRNHSSTYQCRYATLVSASPPAVTAGMPYMPLDPPVTGSQLSASC